MEKAIEKVSGVGGDGFVLADCHEVCGNESECALSWAESTNPGVVTSRMVRLRFPVQTPVKRWTDDFHGC